MVSGISSADTLLTDELWQALKLMITPTTKSTKQNTAKRIVINLYQLTVRSVIENN